MTTLPRPDVSFHMIGDDALLFDPAAGRLFTLQANEATAWCLLCEAGDLQAATAALAEAAGLPLEQAQTWMQSAIALWAGHGLLGEAPARAAGTPTSERRANGPHARFRLLDVTVDLCFDDPADAASALGLLAGFRTEAPAEIAVALIRDGGGCAVVVDGHVAERAARADQAIPALKLVLARLCLSRASGVAALHAAALARDGQAVLLPAPAGSGKSTLAAACALSPGWDFLADDTVVLAGDGLLRPMPFAICLKPGSWAPLSRFGAPGLDRLPVYERLDGLQARYLPPPRPATQPSPMRALVLPRWEAGSTARLEPIGPREAFCAFVPQLFPLAGTLDAALITRIAALVERTRCFALTYDALPDGVALVAEALQP